MKGAIILLILCATGHIDGYKWIAESNGKVPPNPFEWIYSQKTVHVCKATNPSTGLESGGLLTVGEENCVLISNDKKQVNVNSYEVLTKTSPDETFGIYSPNPSNQTPPAKAVSCGPDCYIGQSLSGDALCHESYGRISPSTNVIYFNWDGEVEICPFYVYLLDKH